MCEPTRFECAPQDRLARVDYLAPRFFREVLGWEYEECLVTDDSDLSDYATATAGREEHRAEVESFLTKMQAHYLLTDPATSTRIVGLLELLVRKGVTE
jgi:hypothetical protein